MGNPKRKSKFICLNCLQENCVGDGIQRKSQRNKEHIKDLSCLCVNLEKQTKNLEVRYCDSFDEMMSRAVEIREELLEKGESIIC